MPTTDSTPDLDAFIARWRASSAAERANYVLFLSELAAVLDLARPNPQTSNSTTDAFVFEKLPPLPHGAVGRIDLNKHRLHLRCALLGGMQRAAIVVQLSFRQ